MLFLYSLIIYYVTPNDFMLPCVFSEIEDFFCSYHNN